MSYGRAAKLVTKNADADTLRGMPGSLHSAGRRVGRIAADRSVGGMTLGEEAAVVGECSLLKRVSGFPEGDLDALLLTSSTEMDLTA